MGNNYDYSCKQGTGLEKRVANLFERAKFKVEFDKRVDDGTGTKAQIDVYVVTPEGESIVVECKHREVEADTITKDDFLKLGGRVNTQKLGDIGLLVTDGYVDERFEAFEDKGIFFWDAEQLLKVEKLEGDELRNYIYDYLDLKRVDAEVRTKSKFKYYLYIAGLGVVGLIGLFAIGVVAYLLFPDTMNSIIKFILALGSLTVMLILLAVVVKINRRLNPAPRRRRKKTSRKSNNWEVVVVKKR